MLYRPFENQLNIQLGQHKLHRAQWTILYYLANYGSASLIELAKYQGVEKPTITRTINGLEEMGYVGHIPGKDKREKRIDLTKNGWALYKDVRITIDQFEEDILNGISEEDQQRTIELMGEIRQKILKWGDR
ncbi:MarR family transcriptional regulator [Bacillus salacetis]|uniref:MarR family transcriptional regulator n=1 Tax=Bacillus salacetis TaxID=2315464 RepID=A0A3A1QUE2_9BACI|nr:MarR family transcriptional regulator [Bacillus salacetis]RIW31633.1 MarR family transcriptional regulator [Bacillus salacetis]